MKREDLFWSNGCSTAQAMHGPAAVRPDRSLSRADLTQATKWCVSSFSTRLSLENQGLRYGSACRRASSLRRGLVTDSGRFLQLLDQEQARDLLRLTDPQSHGGGPRAVI
jgi:hypothetical protein